MWTSEENGWLVALGDTRGFCSECRGECGFERPPGSEQADACFELICSGCGAAFLDADAPWSESAPQAGGHSSVRTA